MAMFACIYNYTLLQQLAIAIYLDTVAMYGLLKVIYTPVRT